MTDRALAGRKARRRGLSCERRCINYQRENGRKVWRVRGSPTPDFIGWDVKHQCHLAGEVKNRVLGPMALKNAANRLLELESPPGTVLEIWMERPDGTWDWRWVDKIGTKFASHV